MASYSFIALNKCSNNLVTETKSNIFFTDCLMSTVEYLIE